MSYQYYSLLNIIVPFSVSAYLPAMACYPSASALPYLLLPLLPRQDPSLYIHPESVNRFARGVPLGHFMVSKHPLKPSLSELPSPLFASSESI